MARDGPRPVLVTQPEPTLSRWNSSTAWTWHSPALAFNWVFSSGWGIALKRPRSYYYLDPLPHPLRFDDHRWRYFKLSADQLFSPQYVSLSRYPDHTSPNTLIVVLNIKLDKALEKDTNISTLDKYTYRIYIGYIQQNKYIKFFSHYNTY